MGLQQIHPLSNIFARVKYFCCLSNISSAGQLFFIVSNIFRVARARVKGIKLSRSAAIRRLLGWVGLGWARQNKHWIGVKTREQLTADKEVEIASNLLSCAINNAALYTFTAFYSLRLKIPRNIPEIVMWRQLSMAISSR